MNTIIISRDHRALLYILMAHIICATYWHINTYCLVQFIVVTFHGHVYYILYCFSGEDLLCCIFNTA